MCSGSDHPSEAMRRIKEVDMATSVDDLKTSRSMFGRLFPNFETLDAKIAAFLRKIFPNSTCRKKVHIEEQNAQEDDRFLRGRQIA